MHSLSVKLTAEEYAMLLAKTVSANESKSGVVRKALRLYLLDSSSQEKQFSFLERASDLCGSVDGPKDLSTSSKHMKGYGE